MSETALKFTGERVVLEDMNENDPTVLEHLARYKFALPFCKNKKCLDAACGTGYGTKMILAEGVDVSLEAVEYAVTKYCVRADFYDLELGLPDDRWDVVTSFETIEHLDNPNAFLSDCANYSSQFIFSIPLNNPSAFHKKVYTLDEAKKLIQKYFKNVVWFEQIGSEIIGLQSKYPVFLLGVASN